ncbi:ATP-dependent Clp protease ATP-binding subunit [Solirubrobacter deserti]|uniref:ATP-dependent Clp protease ATP-binding subunit n=1 Tax=Solirubrobacter deserti TaxID=2282478 RepID=A0ABT4RL94_9ACTN|nr:ATP-dependent Clp protease ATP-binding subunit [Solirubrobacter deserti]MDA0139328.1 ATP-dependent Clp protease ATP-binding subunit [Solirubrobacter deserti]
MTEIFDTTPTLCAVCGERPGTVRMVFAAGPQRRTAVLCETCATDLRERKPADPERAPKSALGEFGRDLTAAAKAGRIDPVIGRDDEIAQTIEILSRRRKNNAVLIGEAGVGKTAIAEGLALRIHEQTVPEVLHGTRLVALDLSGMVAGAQFRGQFEQRLKKALEDASGGNTILFIDELHTVLGAGNAEGGMDAANILKPLLARGELRVIGATTLAEYRKIERDSALARRFSAVTVEEPSVDDTVTILRGLRGAYEKHHAVMIDDAALEAAARLSDRYITEYHLPDKAIDLVDQAAARLRLTGAKDLSAEIADAVTREDYERAAELKRRQGADGPVVVGETQIAAVVADRTGIPVGELVEGELERLNDLEDDLHERVIGQDAAVEVVADTIRRARVGLSEGDRPLGSFLFLGPTGVGKTELVKALAERLFATEKALVRIDMSEFREPHTVARLIGSPPGYVGYGDGGQLTEPVRRRPYSVILLDEIEKAHPEVWNVLLQVMDDGRLTDGEGRTVDFNNAVIVMTSNLGAGQAKRGIGFTASAPKAEAARMEEAAKAAFLPEFINRIDEIVTFDALSAEQVERIAAQMVERVGDRLATERDINLDVADAYVARLAQEGFDEAYGARPLQRHIRRTLEKALTRAILAGEIADGDRVHVTEDGSLIVEPAHAFTTA